MKHSILFTGHMIDAAGRTEPRFPAAKEMSVKNEIKKRVLQEKQNGEIIKAVAGGACGGDILFLEVCEELGIPSEMCLALPQEEFKKKSVSFAGTNWEHRFDRLAKKIPVLILPADKNNDPEHNIWAATNAWMLERAVDAGQLHCTLIALWNGKGGDGKGGTEHMIQMAKEKCAHVIIIDINTL
jgi:hypothetical protein